MSFIKSITTEEVEKEMNFSHEVVILSEPYEEKAVICYRDKGDKDLYTIDTINKDSSVDIKLHLNLFESEDRELIFDSFKEFLRVFSSTIHMTYKDEKS